MLKTEFTELTGFCPTDDYYHTVIEPEYEQSDLNKQDWCKQWKIQGGIQRAYDAMCTLREYDNLKASKIEEANIILRQERYDLVTDKQELEKENKELHADRQARIGAHQQMMYALIEISEKYSSAELRQMIIDAIGFKNYIAYKFEHDMNIWKLDREEILKNIQ